MFSIYTQHTTQQLIFCGGRKTGGPEEKPLMHRREPTTNSSHISPEPENTHISPKPEKGLYNYRVNSILALMQRFGYLSRWRREL
jgi:hypothetical protein